MDADVVISMEPEIDTFKNPMQPDNDTGKAPKVNRKLECFPRVSDNSDVDTIKVLSSVDFHFDSIDEIAVICVNSDVGVTNSLSSVVCLNDSLDAITVIGVDSDVEGGLRYSNCG